MNINPSAKRILCYGDSNTHGRDAKRKAQDGIKTRLPVGVRWTSLLQEMLGNDFEVIEEGLGGRTTNLDDPDSERNGLTYLKPCLASHVPIDVVVFMLGTNDLKDRFNRTAQDVANANKELLNVIKAIVPDAKVLLVSPILIDGVHPMAVKNYSQATEKSQQLGPELEKVANEVGCAFLDLAKHVDPSSYDGLHIDETDQAKVAEVVHQKVSELVL
jgi:lysophospholipase L1-like esterase